jgi:lysophospholipase L1-like esterase
MALTRPTTTRLDDTNEIVSTGLVDDVKYPAPTPPPPPPSGGNSLNLSDDNNEYIQRTTDISFAGVFDIKATLQSLVQNGTYCPLFAGGSTANRVLLTQSGTVAVNINGAALVIKTVPNMDISLKNTYRLYRDSSNNVYFQLDNDTPVFISNNAGAFTLRWIGKASSTFKITGIVHNFNINGTNYNLSEGTGDLLGGNWQIKSDLGLAHINENVWFVAPPESASVQVINLGVGGNNAYDMNLRFNTDVNLHSPDMVIITPGTNDAINSYNLLTPTQFKTELLAMVNKTIALNATPVIWNIPPVIDSYKKEDHDYTPYYGDESLFDLNVDILPQFRAKVQEVATETGAIIFDVLNFFTLNGDPQITEGSYLKNAIHVPNDTDGVHFTVAGRQAVANAVAGLCVNKTKICWIGDSNIYAGGADSICIKLSIILNQ